MNRSRRVPTTKILYLAVCVLFTAWVSVCWGDQCRGESKHEKPSWIDRPWNKENLQALWEEAKAAVDEARRIHGVAGIEIAEAYRTLAMLDRWFGRFTEAEDLLKKSLDIQSKISKINPLTYADTLHRLGDIYCEMGRFSEAELLMQQALGIFENSTLLDPNVRAAVIYSQACLYRIIGHWYPAMNLALEGDGQVKSDIPGGQQLESRFRMLLVTLFYGDERPAQTEPVLSSIWEARKQGLGEFHPDTISVQVALGHLYVKMGKWELGEKLLRDALSIQEDIYGRNHSFLADILAKLSTAAEKRLDQSEAEALFQRALQITEDSFGPNDYRIGKLLLDSGLSAFNRNDFALAGSRLQRSVAILGNSPLALQNDHLFALTYLGEVYRAENKPAEAEPFYLKVLTALGDQGRPSCPSRFYILKSLRDIAERLGQKNKAEEYAQRVLEIETDLERKRKAALEEASGTEKETNDSK